jgi:C4-dicarboxylate transporter
MLSGVSLLVVSNVNNPVGLVGLPYVMWSAHFFVTQIQSEKISSWSGPTVHVCCFMLARASTKTFVSRVRKTAKKISLAKKFVSGVTR